MEFHKLIEGFQEAIFEIAWWLIVLPKTFLRALFRPSDLLCIIESELKKQNGERFQDYLPPVVFLLILLIIPLSIYGYPYETIFPLLKDASFGTKLTFLSFGILTVLIPPTYFDAKHNTQIPSKPNYQVAFLKQCYLQAPLLLVFFILFTSLEILLSSTGNRLVSNDLITLIGKISFYIVGGLYLVRLLNTISPRESWNGRESTRLRRLIPVLTWDMVLIVIFLVISRYILKVPMFGKA